MTDLEDMVLSPLIVTRKAEETQFVIDMAIKKHSVENLTEECIAYVEMQYILKNTVYFKANQVKRAKYGKFSLPQFT